MRIRIAVFELRKVRSLAVLQIQSGLAFHRRRHLTNRQNNQIHFHCNGFAKQRIVHINRDFFPLGFINSYHVTLSQENTRIILTCAVKIFIKSWCAHIPINDVCLCIRILLTNIRRLFKRIHAAGSGTIRQMLRGSRTRALNESDVQRRCSIFALNISGFGHLLKFGTADNVFILNPQFSEFFGIIRMRAGGHDDRAAFEFFKLALRIEFHLKFSWLTGNGNHKR